MDAPGRTRARLQWPVAVVVWLLAALVLYRAHDERWYPHDEGTVAHSAERLLDGELPHRDFDEVYTGGLTALHASAFALLGTDLLALRRVLLVVALAVFLPALLALAFRVAPPLAAGTAVLVGVVWSLPCYFASLPSWYDLFLFVLGSIALLSFADTRRRHWLVAAGVCGGAAALMKVSGLGFVAAALLFFVYDEQEEARCAQLGRGGAWLYVIAAAAALLVLALGLLVRRLADPARVFHFVLPGAALVALLVVREARIAAGGWRARASGLLRRVAPFGLGLVLALAPLVLVYAVAGALGDLQRGLFVLPARRLEHAQLAPPPLLEALWAAPLVLLCLFPRVLRGRAGLAIGLALTAAALAAFVGGAQLTLYRAVWSSVRPLPTLLVLVGAVVLARGEERDGRPLFLLLAATAFHALVQFPFSAPIYFGYVAPLVALAGAALLMREQRTPPLAPAAVAVLYLGFAVLWLHRGGTEDMGWGFHARANVVPLDVARGGVRIHRSEADEYAALVEHLSATPRDRPLLALPDCPEVHFLADRENAERALYGFFDDREPASRPLEEYGAIVLNHRPRFSPPLSEAFVARCRAAFPRWVRIGRFEVGTRR